MTPDTDCRLCPRLWQFRDDNRRQEPSWHNAPVPSFGAIEARFLVVGLAPGLMGANRTGRPFTGDYAGDLLYQTLAKHGFVIGTYGRDASDGIALKDCRITNAVRCVPPQNKPLPAEIHTCRPFLSQEIGAMPKLQIILALGTIAHNQVLRVLNHRPGHHKFAHGARHMVGEGKILIDSYHCSRYNTNTGRLTETMFDDIVGGIKAYLASNPVAA